MSVDMTLSDSSIPVVSDFDEFSKGIHRIAASHGATVKTIHYDDKPGTLIVLEGNQPMPGNWVRSLRLMGYRRMTHSYTGAGTELRVLEQ